MKKLFLISVFVSLFFLFYFNALAEVPQMINYQGKLTTPAGAPVNDTIQMVFTIHRDDLVTTPLWSETQWVEVLKGIFNVLLGSVNAIPDSVFDGNIRYLGVKVGDDPEIVPRKPIVSVAYAYKADTDGDWTFRITDIADTTLITGGAWGIARYGNALYGNADSTHVNLGVASTTGEPDNGDRKYCTVGGGVSNTAGGEGATVGGGVSNTASWTYATIGGGGDNTASGTSATVGGGVSNTASNSYATVGGGAGNTASWINATVGGGGGNTASGYCATVGGGFYNSASGYWAIVGGGHYNRARGDYSVVSGGGGYWPADSNSSIGGNSAIGGGIGNTASGYAATVPGGLGNVAFGSYSFAAGRHAKANHAGTFVWADSTDVDFASTGDNQFLIRASGGVGIGTTSPQRALHISDVMRLEPRASAPANPSEGDIYVNSTDHHIYCYLNGVWKQLDN